MSMEALPALHLLLIDAAADQRSLARELSDEADSSPFSLDVAEDLTRGLPLLRSRHYDAVLLDLAQAAPASLDAVHDCHEQLAGLPLLVLTGSGDENSRRALREAGALECFSRSEPPPGGLARAIRAVLERGRDRGEAERLEGEMETMRVELRELHEFQRNVAIFAHEINSPLTGLLGFLQLIVEEVEEQEEDPDRLMMLRDSLEAATRIRKVMIKLHQITEPAYKKHRGTLRTSLLELSQDGESIA